MKRQMSRIPIIINSSSRGLSRLRSGSRNAGIQKTCKQLESGIVYERERGCSNWPGKKQIFSEFLVCVAIYLWMVGLVYFDACNGG